LGGQSRAILPDAANSEVAAVPPARHGKEEKDRWLRRQGIKAVIPRQADQRPNDGRVKFDKDTYKRRAVVEQCVG
jgi:hypothetical protein